LQTVAAAATPLQQHEVEDSSNGEGAILRRNRVIIIPPVLEGT